MHKRFCMKVDEHNENFYGSGEKHRKNIGNNKKNVINSTDIDI